MTVQHPSTVVHRALFQALIEMRERAGESNDKVVWHLADLFHTIVLDLESASLGERSYDDVFQTLTDRVGEKGLGRWWQAKLADLDIRMKNDEVCR